VVVGWHPSSWALITIATTIRKVNIAGRATAKNIMYSESWKADTPEYTASAPAATMIWTSQFFKLLHAPTHAGIAAVQLQNLASAFSAEITAPMTAPAQSAAIPKAMWLTICPQSGTVAIEAAKITDDIARAAKPSIAMSQPRTAE
jgi:hypothetical protein